MIANSFFSATSARNCAIVERISCCTVTREPSAGQSSPPTQARGISRENFGPMTSPSAGDAAASVTLKTTSPGGLTRSDPHVVVWLARKDLNLRSPDPEDSRRFRRWSVRFERGADSDPVDPAGNQVEHAGRSQVNVIRSSDPVKRRYRAPRPLEREWFPMLPVLPDRRWEVTGATPVPLPAMYQGEVAQGIHPASHNRPPRRDRPDRHGEDDVRAHSIESERIWRLVL